MKEKTKCLSYCGESICGDKNSSSIIPFSSFKKDIYPLNIVSGRFHVLLLDINNNIWVIGEGKSGQLGLGENIMFCSSFEKLSKIHVSHPKRRPTTVCLSRSVDINSTAIRTYSDNSTLQNEDKDNNNIETIQSIHTGPLTSALITKSGRLYIWGYTHSKNIYTPELVPLWDSFKVRDVCFGDQHILALVETTLLGNTTRIILSWGKSSRGALGHGEGIKLSSQTKQLRFFDNLNPVRIFAGHTTSAAILENGDFYLWGTCGNFRSWVPRKIIIPTGTIHCLFFGESCLMQNGSHLYCIEFNEPKKGETISSVELSKLQIFDRIKHGIILQIVSTDIEIFMINHRGQLFQSPTSISSSLSLSVIKYNRFVEKIVTTSRCYFVINCEPLLMQSVDKIVLLQQGNYSVPRIVLDVSLFFNNIKDEDYQTINFDLSNSSCNDKADRLYSKYLSFSTPDLSNESPLVVLLLLLKFLGNIKEPLFSEDTLSSLLYKYINADPMYRQINYIQEFLCNDLSPTSKQVLKHTLHIIHKCFYFGDKNTIPITKLYELIFSGIFGNNKENDKHNEHLQMIFTLLMQYSGFWFGNDLCILPIQLDILLGQKNQLYLLDLFIEENDTHSTLCKIITSTSIIKNIITNIFKFPPKQETEWLHIQNILNFCIRDNSTLQYMQILREICTQNLTDIEIETISALFHLLCASKERGNSFLQKLKSILHITIKKNEK